MFGHLPSGLSAWALHFCVDALVCLIDVALKCRRTSQVCFCQFALLSLALWALAFARSSKHRFVWVAAIVASPLLSKHLRPLRIVGHLHSRLCSPMVVIILMSSFIINGIIENLLIMAPCLRLGSFLLFVSEWLVKEAIAIRGCAGAKWAGLEMLCNST